MSEKPTDTDRLRIKLEQEIEKLKQQLADTKKVNLRQRVEDVLCHTTFSITCNSDKPEYVPDIEGIEGRGDGVVTDYFLTLMLEYRLGVTGVSDWVNNNEWNIDKFTDWALHRLIEPDPDANVDHRPLGDVDAWMDGEGAEMLVQQWSETGGGMDFVEWTERSYDKIVEWYIEGVNDE